MLYKKRRVEKAFRIVKTVWQIMIAQSDQEQLPSRYIRFFRFTRLFLTHSGMEHPICRNQTAVGDAVQQLPSRIIQSDCFYKTAVLHRCNGIAAIAIRGNQDTTTTPLRSVYW